MAPATAAATMARRASVPGPIRRTVRWSGVRCGRSSTIAGILVTPPNRSRRSHSGPGPSLERAANAHLPRYANVSDRTLLRYVSGWLRLDVWLAGQVPAEVAGDRRQPYLLLHLLSISAGRPVGMVGHVPDAPGQPRAPTGISRGEQQPAEQAEVLEELDLLLLALARVLDLPEPVPAHGGRDDRADQRERGEPVQARGQEQAADQLDGAVELDEGTGIARGLLVHPGEHRGDPGGDRFGHLHQRVGVHQRLGAARDEDSGQERAGRRT